MHPAFLDNMSWEMAEVYGAITDQILINLARHFPFYQYVEELPTSAFTYQAKMLAQIGQVNKETIRIIRNGLEDADLALQGVLEQAIIDAVKTAEPELLEGVKSGVFQMPTTPIIAPNQMRAFQLYYEQAAQKLNLVNTVMLESTQSAYQQMVSDVVSQIELSDKINRTQIAIDTATGEIVTGVSSWNQAIKHATDSLKNGGITGFIDHAGRQWSAEGYVAMDMRTTVFNTGRAATWETNQNFGNDLYVVSYHNGARPLCYPWQNKVISSMDSSRKVIDLDGNEIQVIPQSATSYGQPAGLFGINCKHYPTPFIPGVSVIEGHPQDPEANVKTYEESQKQRALERKLREEKRDLQMLKEQGASDEDIAKQRAKCRQTSEEIDEFCKSTGRARHRDREAVYTKREFPPADRYDVAAFERDQKELIDNYYQTGGEQQRFENQFSTDISKPLETNDTNEVKFIPAQDIKTAEEFAKNYVDTSGANSVGISFDGVDVEVANTVNNRLYQFTKDYQYDSFGGLAVAKENTAEARMLGNSSAAYNGITRNMLLNGTTFKTVESVAQNLAEQQNIVNIYLQNPDNVQAEGNVLRILKGSMKSGRAHVSTNINELLDHELGHALIRDIERSENYMTIQKKWSKFAPRISGEATLNINEYIAESFSAWRKGEKIKDRELIKVFNALKR